MVYHKKYNIVIVLLISVICGMGAGYAQDEVEQADPVDFEQKIGSVEKDMKILRREIRKVRSSVSALAKEIKSGRNVPEAVTELNVKLEEYAQTVTSLSGEVYRMSSTLDDRSNKRVSDRSEFEKMYRMIYDNEQTIQDLQGEILIIREVQADLSTQPNREMPDAENTSSSRERMWRWKYWGPVSFGVALVALIIAL